MAQLMIEVPGTKISELEKTSSVSRGDVIPVVQDEETKQADIGQISDFVKSELGSAALKDVADFATPTSVAEVSQASQMRDDAQNERIERMEYSVYLFQKNGVYKAYRTKALMLLDVSNIPVNSIVTVVDDPDNNPDINDINGEYHFDGNDFLKLENNVLGLIKSKMAQAESNSKSYTDTEIKNLENNIDVSVENLIGKFVLSSDSENIFEFKDSSGNVVLALNKKGQLVSYDEDTKRSILLTNQEDIKELQKFVDELNLNNISVLLKLLATSNSSDLYTFEDSDGNIVLRLTKNGMLRSGQIDGLHNAVDALEYLKKLSKQSDDSKLIRFEDAEKNLLGYVDKFGNWVFNGVDVLNEINELKKFKNKAQAVTALKQIAVKAPESIIQIYLTDLPNLPDAKGTTVSGKGEFHFDGQSFSCFVKLEVQGASSASYAKKNWNIAFFSDQALTKALDVKIGDLLPHDELVFKSNWIDHTNIRNAMCYRLWEQFCSTRTGYPRLEVETPLIGKKGKDALQNGANGVPRLYSALLYINDEFYGLGSFGTAKKRGNYNIAKNKPKEILIGMDGWNNITNLEVTNPTLYELKAPSSPTIETFNAISGWNAFTQLNDADFALQANTYLNKQNAIDFMIFAEFVKCRDVVSVNSVKNLQFISYDGKRFMFMPYDMDTVIGLEWTGEVVYDDTTGSQTMDNSQTSFWRKVKKTYNSEIEARYKQLRDLKIISVDSIYNLSTDLLLKYPISLYDLELNRWPARPSLNITSLEQILTWTKKRIQFLDTFFNYTA
ncbi:CotH kinase family protein [Acinetobacter baumannii]|uniref:CotH kinase family protein n=1 Tax=Acinetobacter baumannii TaxID=470 RepID=UPI0024B6D354|nr:CotH kinase family protein [Acinetobacter baumannii]MDI9751611.1 CotH kinase family protein [Acinetobacter baumannii]MDQ9772007.1 CotH kinase family protein [Acinetobacter baumannii]